MPVVLGGLACLAASLARAQVPPPPEGAPVTPALQRLIGGELAPIAEGLEYAEGPLWHPGGYLIFADSARNLLHRWDPEKGTSIYRQPSGITTAVALDREGRLLAAEQQFRRISRTARDGAVSTLVDRYEGHRLNGPNDLTVASSGAVFFTDPPYGLPRQTEGKELDFQGVYRLDAGGTLALLVRDMVRPNGIGLSPDETRLYVTDTERGELHAFTLGADGRVAADRKLADITPWKPGVTGVADGLTLDAGGRIYVAGPGGVWVFDQNGGRLGVIATPEPPSACAFGGDDGKQLFITARSRVYRLRMKVAGGKGRG